MDGRRRGPEFDLAPNRGRCDRCAYCFEGKNFPKLRFFPEERGEFAPLGLDEPGLHKVIRTGYETLDLITYFTAGEPEVHAWTIARGTKAPQAAGKIHSDFERGFIRAEVMKRLSKLDRNRLRPMTAA